MATISAIAPNVREISFEDWQPEQADQFTAAHENSNGHKHSAEAAAQQKVQPNTERPAKKAVTPLRGKTLAEIEEILIDYLWEPWLPKMPSIIVGEEGIGKSLFLIYIARCLTTGEALHGGFTPQVGKVLVFSAEDYADSVIKPRARIAGVDFSEMIIFDEPFHLGEDGRLEEAIDFYKPAWVYFDPVLSYFPPGLNPNNPADVRSVVTPLGRICRKYNVAISLLLHLNKAKGDGDARKAVNTSGEWRNSARSVIYVGADPNDRSQRAIYRRKTNYSAEEETGLAYQIESVVDDLFCKPDGSPITIPRFKFIGPSTMTLETTLTNASLNESSAEAAETTNALADAERFLRTVLGDGRRWKTDVEDEAKEAGISFATLRRAKASLGVYSDKPKGKPGEKFGGQQKWWWVLPGKEALPDEDAHDEDAQAEQVEHLHSNDSKTSTYSCYSNEDAQPARHLSLDTGGDEHLH